MRKKIRKKKEKRKKIRKTNDKEKRRENKNLFIQINRVTDRQRDNRHKSFIDMWYNTEQYDKSSSIE